MKIEHDKHAYAVTKQNDILYNGFDQIFKADAYKGVAGSMIRSLFKPDVSAITGKKNLDEAIMQFISTAPFMKNSGFHEEREYRIMGACFRASKIPDKLKSRTKEIKFRNRGDLIIPYIELFKDQNLPIKSILVGPHSHQEKQAEALAMFLEMHDLKVEVRKSFIPFRF